MLVKAKFFSGTEKFSVFRRSNGMCFSVPTEHILNVDFVYNTVIITDECAERIGLKWTPPSVRTESTLPC